MDTQLTNLKVEYRVNPLGIDADRPRFSWNMKSNLQGQKQTAYQILVASNTDLLTPESADVWNSGKVISDTSVAVKYNGNPLAASTKYFWKVIVWDTNNESIHPIGLNYFETGLRSTDGITGWSGAKWIAMDHKEPNSPGAPMFRKEQMFNQKVKSARLYISSLGVFDVQLNGKKVGIVNEDGSTTYEHMCPGWTNFDTTVYYMTYDVTRYVKGDHKVTLAATVGNGWYNSRISEGSKYYSESGNDLALFAKLLITFEDHSSQVIVTNTNSGWKTTDKGPVRFNEVYDGEEYDATKEILGWNHVGFNDDDWNHVKEHDFINSFPNVKVVSFNGYTAQIIDELDQYPRSIVVYNDVVNIEESKNSKGEIKIDHTRTFSNLSAGVNQQVVIHAGDTAVYDLGQNMVGVPRITVKGNMGTQIRLRFGEILNDDSEGADGPKGSVYFANLRTAKQTSLYTIKGGENAETYQASLTFFGFRFVEIAVLTEGASVEIIDLTGKVATSATKQVGMIETSHKDINQLFSNVIWGQRGNYFWVPTDCPQRDERLGWTGDTQLFANTALYNADSNLFLENFMSTLVDSQAIYGYDQASFTSTAPGYKFANFNSFEFEGVGPKGQSGWADVGVILPWTVWQMTGDRSMIENHYEAMVKYMDWQYSITGDHYKGPGGIGDWLGFQGTGNQLMSDVYYAYDAKLMAQMAKVINNIDDTRKYEALFENIKKSFIERYISLDQNGNIVVKSSYIEDKNDIFEDGIAVYKSIKEDNTQSALLWCLKLGLYESEGQKDQMIIELTENIKNNAAYKAAHPASTRVSYAENTLSIGFLGVNIIAPVLSDLGFSDLAYALLLQDKMPSWLYSVKNGATTIWERWNSYSVENGFGDVGMNSFNHYSYGAIAEWMYKYMTGIANNPSVPGFKHIILQPRIDSNQSITMVKGSYESVYGTIKSEWEVNSNLFIYKVEIPANTTATVFIPAKSKDDILLDYKPVTIDGNVTFVELKNETAVFEIGSGSYTFQSKCNIGTK